MKKNTPLKNIMVLLAIFIILALFYLFQGLDPKYLEFYLDKRIVKVIVIILVSYAIGHSCVAFQTITGNNILTPSVMGLDSLYMLIQTVVVFFFGSKTLTMMAGWQNFLFSVVIMLGCSFLLFRLLFRGESQELYFLILTGMICGSLFSGLATFMQVILDPNEFSVLQGKMFASFNNVNENMLLVCIATSMAMLLISFKDLPKLDVVLLGRDNAINLGIPYKSLVLKNLMLIAVLVSISTVLVGPITFLGLITVSLSRRIIKTYKHAYQVGGAFLLGCIALTGGLLIVERLLNYEITINVIINFVGGIYFIYLLLKERSG